MSTHIAIDVREGDEPIVLVVDGYEAPMTTAQARVLAKALCQIAAENEPDRSHLSWHVDLDRGNR